MPAHTRLDEHMTEGDPYEQWVTGQKGINFSVAPISVGQLSEAFDGLAVYSNKHFLSNSSSMKITLISAPWLFKEEVEFISQNLGLGYLASYLEKRGHNVLIIDALTEGISIFSVLCTKYADTLKWGLTDEEIIKQIPADSQLIGITAPFTDSRFVVNPLSIKIKKAIPAAILVMGGVYPSTLPEEALRLSGVDAVVIGEGEIPLSQIAAGKKIEEIKGLAFKKDGQIWMTGAGEIVTDIDKDIPAPSYDLRPMEKYVQWSPRGNKLDMTLSMVSSRGCPFQCKFCSIHNVYGYKWRAFSASRVINEIKEAVLKFGVNHVEFEDDNLTLDKNRAMDIFEGIKNLRGKNGEKIIWSAPNGVMINSLDRELIFKMKESGAKLIYLPVESGDEKILELMNKGNWRTHLKKTLEVLGYSVKAGIETRAFIIIGYPGENKASFEKTKKYCQKLVDLGVDAITPLVATPYPNTELYNLCKKNNWLVNPDTENVLIYQRYSKFLPEFVQINTPWCSKEEVYERYQTMVKLFPTKHSVRKEAGN